MKKLKVFIIMSLMMIFLVKPRTVLAKSLDSFQPKMINENSNYRIYQKLTRKGPAGSMGLARTFKYGNFQANAVRKVGKSKYYYVWIDGHKAGWLNQRAFLRDKIDVAKNVSLVKNSHYSFPTRDAINFATDSTGTVIDLDKVKASQDEVLSNDAGKHKIKFSYGKARAHTVVEVRSNAHEGVAKANKTEQAGKAASSWFKHYKTSGNWGKGASYAPETKPHVLKSKPFRLKTYFYQPATLSQDGEKIGVVGPVPEGVTISNGSMYATMYESPHNTRAHIVAYKFNHVPNRYVMQKLPWLPWAEFTRLASEVKVSPNIKLGHGQEFGATDRYIYAIANDHLLRHSAQSEEIMQISKKDLRIKRIWTFKIWNKSAKDGRYVHNAVFVNDKKFIAVYHSATEHRFEYWEVARRGNSWHPVEIGATKGEFMRNNSPVQGIAYDKKRKQIYLAFNDYLFKTNRAGKVLTSGHFHTGREFEGICVNDSYLYAELAQRPELLRQKIK